MRKVSLITSVIGLIISGILLVYGISCINASGWDGFGEIFIGPAIILIIILAIDFKIAYTNATSGLAYSCVISLLKLAVAIFFIYISFVDFTNFKPFNIVSSFFIFITIPSACNAKRLMDESKKKIKTKKK